MEQGLHVTEASKLTQSRHPTRPTRHGLEGEDNEGNGDADERSLDLPC